MIKHPGVGQGLKYLMENQTQTKVYSQYNHTDACKYSRWTARECYQLMYARPWPKVIDFYFDVVNGGSSLFGFFGTKTHHTHDNAEIIEVPDKCELVNDPPEDRTGRWARVTYKVVFSYHGDSFDGWQKQPGLKTVQGVVERSLGQFIDDKKAQLLKDKGLPIEGCAVVAGRTDKGVTAFHQVCSFYTWRRDVEAKCIEDAINNAAPGMLRVISVSEVSRVFHPNFSAKWRRYLYIFPLNDGELDEDCSQSEHKVKVIYSSDGLQRNEDLLDNNEDEMQTVNKPTKFRVSKVNQLLRQLEGKLLSYKMFARDTKASRNVGPPTECFMFHARAVEATLPSAKDGSCIKAMCVELVANRFLRKMVRVLVATSIREAAAGAEDNALLKLMDATCRRATAPPAPPHGLCLVNVGYTDFDSWNCLIRILRFLRRTTRRSRHLRRRCCRASAGAEDRAATQ